MGLSLVLSCSEGRETWLQSGVPDWVVLLSVGSETHAENYYLNIYTTYCVLWMVIVQK